MSSVDLLAAAGAVAHLTFLAVGSKKDPDYDVPLKTLHNCTQHHGVEDDESSSSPDFFICQYFAALSSTTLIVAAILFYFSLSLLYNLIAWYKFVAAWNLILRARRMDMAHARRQKSYQQQLLQKTMVHVQCMSSNNHNNMSCPICLTDFFEQELVSACDDGCGSWFHRECLFEWLSRSDSCPCCRKDMKPPPDLRHRWIGINPSCFGFSVH